LYGLKLKDLFIPPMNHRSEVFASFSKAHWQAAPLLDERASYLGIIGIGAFLWLLLTGLRAMVERRERDVPLEVWQILWIVLMFTTGGLNAIIGSAGITMFRAGCRYSVVILLISLLWAARRLTVLQARSEESHPGEATTWQWYAVASAVGMMVLWDQVPRPPTAQETTSIIRQVDADREFVGKMEAALPAGAMVFQLPIMEFPEMPAPGVPPYDHFRSYLYSKNLRYSFGSMKGRPREAWQKELGKRSLEEAVAEIKKRGFAAIYINRNGFPDRALPVEKALRAMGYTKPPIVSAIGDLVCIPLEKP
jgi:phosphoglycerol transferase